ncbi:HlyD family efflux transporter periplasmic adaptor subunit [Chlorogloeopsis sp. ULAP01]|uniref:HlyD family efflux transporter periplasmic adaptor subunit n=1 Tax=Chlorogloeopsis sp. ULAP01 TaxID=3056483 RepID=UPI0025AAFAA5|nr:HlyD family efflux transporter periplasmic adaptor subunit [Chlorogloeopsis sp. ULAP01]MDM9384723.1 HlyD family efflux transporter periplasmic adaptor subunit [Chlorogloeopsis sp. ULAP01]
MNTNNGNGTNGNGKYSSHSSNENGHTHSSIPEAGSIQQLEQIASQTPQTSDIQPKPPSNTPRYVPKFDQPVILKQPRTWSRAILWGLMLSTAGAIIWANIATIEEAVSATGKLEASGATKEVQAPVGGVVKEIFVEDGKQVKQGQRLVSLDSTTALAQLDSLQKIRSSLMQENRFYQTQLTEGMREGRSNRGRENTLAPTLREAATASTLPHSLTLSVPKEMLDLTKSRAALVAENQVYRTQLDDNLSKVRLTLEQKERFLSNQIELNARVAAAGLEIDQSKRQLQQAEIKLATTKETLAMNQGILDNVTPLMQSGAISKIQYLKQEQEVRNALSEIDQLIQEKARLQSAIAQGVAKLQNTVALSRRDWLNQIAENNKRIAEIDSQLTKAIVENNKRIAEIDSQLAQTRLNLKYQEIVAPVAGTIFELKAHTPGFVVTVSEPILKVVPTDVLIAKVFITNKDIGFVKEGMTVDVRIDSFPKSEFGDIKGKLVWIGSDALPPDQIYPFYRFPAKVQLEQQSLLVNGRKIPLQSGMSIGANIKLRERTVMSIFTDMFSSSVESLKTVR